ncbi:hypothetical protein ONZ43_g5793 [Nemania bipapillata]|uniref:Uncharacterized protein n=1 Tax=Nemania bipapillata TaxID=110536 RepID=A0ACC2I6G1_9PEZI|nr:hypothetical protein ONZ43_g5793 [Nemania bipapillata]
MDLTSPRSRSSLHQQQQAGLEVVPPETGLYPLPTPAPFYSTPGEASPKGGPADIESRGQGSIADRSQGKDTGSARRRILGLSIPVFWAVIVTLFVVLAAGIGGGVGGGLSAQRKSVSESNVSSGGDTSTTASSISVSSISTGGTPATSTTPTSVASSPTASSTVDNLVPTDGGCPGIDGVAYTAYSADGNTIPLEEGGSPQEFREQCYTNWVNTDSTHDILRTYTPTLENCIVVCAEYNKAYLTNLAAGTGVGGGPCVAVTIVKDHAGFCYLKNGTATNNTMGNPKMYSSATLLTSMNN